MADQFNYTTSAQEVLDNLSHEIIKELRAEYSHVNCSNWNNIIFVLNSIFTTTRTYFIFIIDEWDSVFRMHKDNLMFQKIYLDFLRKLLKGKSYVALAYMTGILPIKKYGEHSALNMFTEISMTKIHRLAEFTGFTENDVLKLCKKYDMPFDEMKQWYDGYNLNGMAIYNPNSVMESIRWKEFDSYWTSTETYEALKIYIGMNFDGLKDKVTKLIAGEEIMIDPDGFTNDMTSFSDADDVLTLLVHLG